MYQEGPFLQQLQWVCASFWFPANEKLTGGAAEGSRRRLCNRPYTPPLPVPVPLDSSLLLALDDAAATDTVPSDGATAETGTSCAVLPGCSAGSAMGRVPSNAIPQSGRSCAHLAVGQQLFRVSMLWQAGLSPATSSPCALSTGTPGAGTAVCHLPSTSIILGGASELRTLVLTEGCVSYRMGAATSIFDCAVK